MTAFSNKPPRHEAYLLHLWEERLGQATTWRFRLVDTHSGQSHSFADLKGVVGFLQAILAASGEADSMAEKSGGVAGLIQRLQNSMRPLSDSELGDAAAGSATPKPPEPESDEQDELPPG